MLHPLITSVLELKPTRKIGIPERLIRLGLPFTIGLLYYIPLLPIIGYDRWLVIGGLMVAYILPPAGKESVIPIGIALGFPWYLMAFTIALMDILTGIFMALNFDVALKIPGLGRWMRRFISNGEKFFRKRPWLERFYFTGVVVFVMVPLQGSGGVGGTLVGRMMGMSPGRVLAAITVGALSGCSLIALGSQAIWELILADPAIGITVLIVTVAGIAGVYLFYRYRLKKMP
jgi:uncharacterized membrane protein